MKEYTIYECEKCGKQSKYKTEIMKCEMAHSNLTEKEQEEWENIKKKLHKPLRQRKHKEEQEDFWRDVDELFEFEGKHGLLVTL